MFPDDAHVTRWLQDLASQPASAAPHAMNALIEPLVHLPNFDMAQVWDEVSQIDPFSPNDPNALALVRVPDRRFGLGWDEWWVSCGGSVGRPSPRLDARPRTRPQRAGCLAGVHPDQGAGQSVADRRTSPSGALGSNREYSDRKAAGPRPLACACRRQLAH